MCAFLSEVMLWSKVFSVRKLSRLVCTELISLILSFLIEFLQAMTVSVRHDLTDLHNTS